ncbi:DNA polymerase iota [Eublepharis macularius]|uniref:DNA polymerase iota n=1 Tax=Eublepharis macularius TaxID=481883 RepID=A0AA97JSH0_EUBMA|nr:DNA polymerase iota [Eublepharis macularius]
MESSGEDEAAAGEPDWLLPAPHGRLGRGSTGHGKVMSSVSSLHRVVVHLDLDCYYAQVEMICNPELRGKPLGVQQKSYVITCNYEARGVSVKKLMSLKEAKKKCPELVLVNGEDLTKYREMSYKVTALLEEFTPLVERLGPDENFVDVTEMVEKRLEEWGKDATSQISISGHIYNNQAFNFHDSAHRRLAAGSHIAAEMREAVRTRLGLTGCAGVASNKLLSKMVCGTFKPNQQTVLLPESQQDLMASLDHITKVPGIGFKTAQRLAVLGLFTIWDLQRCSSAVLERELGVSAARHLQKLSYGEDDSPVTPSRPPQSFSDEDSFKKCSSEAEVKKKVGELIANLLDRVYKDGRKPHTIRLSLRKFSPTNKWLSRESRQCPIPSHVVQRIGADDSSVQTQLVAIAMKLFHKMINVKASFHITLLSVCFSNLKSSLASTKQSIGFYLTRPSPSKGSKLVQKMEDTESVTPEGQMGSCEILPDDRNTRVTQMPPETPNLPEQTRDLEFPSHLLPAGIDYDVFNQLPREIKEEIISSQKGERNTAASVSSNPSFASREERSDKAQDQMSHAPLHSRSTHQNMSSLASSDIKSPIEASPTAALGSVCRCLLPSQRPLEAAENASASKHAMHTAFKNSSPSRPPFHQACVLEPQKQTDGGPQKGGWKGESKCNLPSSVDAKTFSELPTEIQKELLVEWESREPVSKMHATTPNKLKTKKPGGLPSPRQSNSLLRYFKPT